MAYNKRRWGGDGWTNSLRSRGKAQGQNFAGWATWPNTVNAHRLCYFLKEKDKKNTDLTEKQRLQRGLELVNKYFEMTYERGENISTFEGAARALEELGFAKLDETINWLQQGGGTEEVIEADEYAKRELDIHGVPHFVISQEGEQNQPVAFGGAQGVATFMEAFRQQGVDC
eukprot:gnl/MRDRNA2_/MRDRNA2_130563_c0_seq1.p1 gnl/MRDRNA2_/MRDRNA2_130563_c0~~gnl/MRDRNA2_/MRDRNA2_130563_c0_seq1.p1  ORF type:complete len:172 (+),score=33.28 gnl/MRDRNA2_/MRDRNA2_130563_c0_seq1:472-987(+)